MNKAECARILTVIAAVFPSFDLTPERVAAWHSLLGDLDYRIADLATRRFLETVPHMPTPADIRREAGTLTREPDLSSGEAWGLALEAIKRYFVYHPTKGIASLPPLVARACVAIGWNDMCLEENIPAIRAHFMRTYDTMLARDERERLLPDFLRAGALLGEAEQQRQFESGLHEIETSDDHSASSGKEESCQTTS